MLVNQKSKAAIAVLKKYLLFSPPATGSAYYIAYQLKDSLSLSKNLFPKCTTLYKDSLWGPVLLNVGLSLCDSGIIGRDVLLQNKKDIIKLGAAQLQQLKKDKEDYPMFNNKITTVLAGMDDKNAIEQLYGFLKINDPNIKYHACLLLLKSGHPVPPAEIKLIAANKNIRTYFYDTLSALRKEKLFPVEYLSQSKFAESYLYNYLTEDEEIENIRLEVTGEGIALLKGVRKRYYLFKITEMSEGERLVRLGICGPFDIDKTSVAIQSGKPTCQYFYDEKYTESAFNRLFKKFIAALEDE